MEFSGTAEGNESVVSSNSKLNAGSDCEFGNWFSANQSIMYFQYIEAKMTKQNSITLIIVHT